MTPSEIEPATFRFVVQYLNHCVTTVPTAWMYSLHFPLHLLRMVLNEEHQDVY
jgi:hypothetical protein